MTDAPGFIAQLKPASFRGVPFGVLSSRKVFGRRTAVHEYPFRDTVWVEDLGRKGRVISFTAFLVTDSLVYGGGDVIAQQEKLIGAIETKGSGKLVHPTLGELTVSVTGDCAFDESFESLGYIALELSFLEAGERVFPSQSSATPDKVSAACAEADKAVSGDFSTAVTPLLADGAITAQNALATATAWVSGAVGLGRDAGSLFNLASQLSGNFGRFFNGNNLGGLTGALGTLLDPSITVGDLIGIASAAQSLIASAASTVIADAGELGQGTSGSTPAQLATDVHALVAAVQASAADPADAVRLMAALQAFTPMTLAAGSAIGAPIGDLVRRAAVVAMARASTTYQPFSYDDANAVRGRVCDALDAEIQVAGDQGADATFSALRALRVAVVQDLTARGATLAPIVTITAAEALPAVVLAQRLYRDAGRGDQLVTEADPINPLFMPTSFQALAA